MGDSPNSLTAQKFAVGSMTCVTCEVLVEPRLRDVPGVERVRVDHARGFAEVEHRGQLDIAALQRAVEEGGYRVSPWDERVAEKRKTTTRDYAEIAGLFVVLVGVVFVLQLFGLMPRGVASSDTMSFGLVFLIGLVASVLLTALALQQCRRLYAIAA